MSFTVVPHQLEPGQAREELRDLTLVGDTCVLGDQPVAGAGMRRDDLEYPRGAIRQTHRHPRQRIAHRKISQAGRTFHSGRTLPTG
jgi:hypothetical protein